MAVQNSELMARVATAAAARGDKSMTRTDFRENAKAATNRIRARIPGFSFEILVNYCIVLCHLFFEMGVFALLLLSDCFKANMVIFVRFRLVFAAARAHEKLFADSESGRKNFGFDKE